MDIAGVFGAAVEEIFRFADGEIKEKQRLSPAESFVFPVCAIISIMFQW